MFWWVINSGQKNIKKDHFLLFELLITIIPE